MDIAIAEDKKYDAPMLSTSHIRATRILWVLCFCAWVQGCAVVSETEYKEFTPMAPHSRVMNHINLTWEVREDVGDYCKQAQKKAGTSNAPPIACAVWVASSNQCKVITGPNPNHVVLGHEVRHCFEGHFHR